MQLNWSDILARLQFEKGQFVLISNINKKNCTSLVECAAFN